MCVCVCVCVCVLRCTYVGVDGTPGEEDEKDPEKGRDGEGRKKWEGDILGLRHRRHLAFIFL